MSKSSLAAALLLLVVSAAMAQTGPGTCKGTAYTCFDTSANDCPMHEGCHIEKDELGVNDCVGTPTDCSTYEADGPCEQQNGCTWYLASPPPSQTDTPSAPSSGAGSCAGVATSCDVLPGGSTCVFQQGCMAGPMEEDSFISTCEGSVIPCTSLTDHGLCQTQQGCTWVGAGGSGSTSSPSTPAAPAAGSPPISANETGCWGVPSPCYEQSVMSCTDQIGCAVAPDINYAGAQTCAGTVPSTCRYISDYNDCFHQIGCEWFGSVPTASGASPPAPPTMEEAAAPWPWTNVQIAVQAAAGEAALEGTSCAINPDTRIDPKNVVGDGQGSFFFEAANLLGHNELTVGQIDGQSCGSAIIPVSDFLGWTGINLWACSPVRTATRRLLQTPAADAQDEVPLRYAGRRLLHYSDVCSTDFQPPQAEAGKLYNSSYAGLQYYAPTSDADKGPDALCYIDTSSAPNCIWGCVDMAALNAATGEDIYGLCMDAMNYKP